jgi:hypothetical protein
MSANVSLQVADLSAHLERVRKAKDSKVDLLTEEKLIELLKKEQNEEILKTLATQSAILSSGTEKGA